MNSSNARLWKVWLVSNVNYLKAPLKIALTLSRRYGGADGFDFVRKATPFGKSCIHLILRYFLEVRSVIFRTEPL